MSDVIRLASENYVNQEIPTKLSELENDSGYSGYFIAEYGKTTYDEVVKAYYEGKTLYCSYKPDNTTRIIMCSLQYIENGTYSKELGLQGHLIFIFGAMENGNEYRLGLWGSAHSKGQEWTIGVVNLKDVLDAQQRSIHELSKMSDVIENHSNEIIKRTTDYKHEHIPINGKYKLREKGFYIFGGSDYDLNLCDASGNTIGKEDALVVIVFCTEADANGNFMVYVMQNYKGTLGVSSMDGKPYANFTSDYYVHNTNTSEPAYVYYMRQNKV